MYFKIHRIRKWRGDVKTFFLMLAQQLPKFVRYYLIRKSFPVDSDLPPGLEFKIADTCEELESAFRLLYSEFQHLGYSDSNPAGLRITKYHALPSTTVLIGKLKGEVICTLTVIQDSPLGLPLEPTWDLQALRQRAPCVAEISGLAIKRNLQGGKGRLLLPFCKFMYEYCYKYAGIDLIVISTLDSVRDFYKAILLFESIGDGIPKRYEFVKGVIANAQFLDLRKVPECYSNVYGKMPDRYNLYLYFLHSKISCFNFPRKVRGQRIYPVMTPGYLDYFFNKKISMFKSMAIDDLAKIQSVYSEERFFRVIETETIKSGVFQREQRVPSKIEGRIYSVASSFVAAIVVLDISPSGMKARLSHSIPLGESVRIILDLEDDQRVSIEAISVWNDLALNYGFQLSGGAKQKWNDYIERLKVASTALDSDDLRPKRKTA